MDSSFVNFCLKCETSLIKNTSKKDSIIDFKKSIINLPRLSAANSLSIIILSDGSTFYLPCSMFSISKKYSSSISSNIIKFLSSKSDLFSSLVIK
jgi:hypothetical protein